jgi:hypothetical protein
MEVDKHTISNRNLFIAISQSLARCLVCKRTATCQTFIQMTFEDSDLTRSDRLKPAKKTETSLFSNLLVFVSALIRAHALSTELLTPKPV